MKTQEKTKLKLVKKSKWKRKNNDEGETETKCKEILTVNEMAVVPWKQQLKKLRRETESQKMLRFLKVHASRHKKANTAKMTKN